MEKLTAYLGFEARYVVFPLIALLAGGCAKLVIGRYLRHWARKTKNRFDDLFVGYLDSLMTPVVLIAVLYGLSHWLPLSDKAAAYLRQGLQVCVICVLAFLSAKLTSSLLVLSGEGRESWQKYLQHFRTLSAVLFGLIAAALVLKVLRINLAGEGIRLMRIVGILAGAYVVIKIVGLGVAQMERLVEDKDPVLSEAEKRAKTLGKIIKSTAAIIVAGVAVMMILSEFGMNIAPIITGAGIAGIAVGFGAQNLVRDVISGFFLIFEDQIRVGDYVRINGFGGTVETMRLRTTVLRDVDGTVHIFPNGEIKQVSNQTKEYSYCVVDVGVAYGESVDRVMEVLAGVGAELREDAGYAPLLLEPLEVMGVQDLAASQVAIRVRIKTLPLKQWMVARELRRRIKNRFDRENIEIPFPQLQIHLDKADKPA